MATKQKNKMEDLTIVDAIETLSSIAELGADKDVGIVEERELVMKDKKIPYRSVRWLHNNGGEATLAIVKDIFRVILDYLKNFYEKSYAKVKDEQAAEGIRTIMVLVGEAAKNLDKYGNLFAQTHQPLSVTELSEFKLLQTYYLTKIAPRIDEGHLGKWILALSGGQVNKKAHLRLKHVPSNVTAKHIYVDLDSVKRDTEYELFFMRKEDGTRFFNPRLIRNLKLVCDVGNYFRTVEKGDPLKRLDFWMDKYIQACAEDMVNTLRGKLDGFFKEAMRHKGKPLVEELTKTAMALLLSSSPRHLLSNHPPKSCLDYFVDFKNFLRIVLHSKEFQKLIVTPPGVNNKIGACIRETVLGICRALYLHAKGQKALHGPISELFKKAEKETPKASSAVLCDSQELMHLYEALKMQINRHVHGPLNKTLDLLIAGDGKEFDPHELHNIASPQFALFFGDKRLIYTRLPSPTHQEYIHRAFVNEEFKNYLFSCETGHGVKKHLCIVMQDRTTWRETARCHAIEGLLHHKDFASYLDVATFSVDTDFYHQRGIYNKDDNALTFKQQLQEHLMDEQSGYFFAAGDKHVLFKEFIPHVTDAIHGLYFNNNPKLIREERLAFIDLTHLLITLKLAELSKVDAVSFCCKDGLDTSVAMSGLLYAFCRGQNNHKKGDDSLKHLLFTPALLWRERAIHSECFFRLCNTLKLLETTIDKHGREPYRQALQKCFSKLMVTPIWEAEIG